MKPKDVRPISVQLHSLAAHTEEDRYLGWTLFKDATHPELGLHEERPLMINVKHRAQTYVVGIPEEYVDAKSKSKMGLKRERDDDVDIRYSKQQLPTRFIKEDPCSIRPLHRGSSKILANLFHNCFTYPLSAMLL
jgi:hypothetical protein